MIPTPGEAAEKRIILSEEYSRLSDEMGELEQKVAMYFVTHRVDYKSDTACERAFDATEDGQRLIFLHRRTKGLEKEISALNSYLRTKENEARNYY